MPLCPGAQPSIGLATDSQLLQFPGSSGSPVSTDPGWVGVRGCLYPGENGLWFGGVVVREELVEDRGGG